MASHFSHCSAFSWKLGCSLQAVVCVHEWPEIKFNAMVVILAVGTLTRMSLLSCACVSRWSGLKVLCLSMRANSASLDALLNRSTSSSLVLPLFSDQKHRHELDWQHSPLSMSLSSSRRCEIHVAFSFCHFSSPSSASFRICLNCGRSLMTHFVGSLRSSAVFALPPGLCNCVARKDACAASVLSYLTWVLACLMLGI